MRLTTRRRGLLAALVTCLFVAGAPAAHASWPGRNGDLAFAASSFDPRGPALPGGLWHVGRPGMALDAFPGTASDDASPSYSPDGRRLLFTSGSPRGLWVMKANGSGRTLVRSGELGSVSWASWSPNGRRIVFDTSAPDGSGPLHLAVINADGTGERALTSGHNDFNPRWSPAGGTIAFLRSNESGNGGSALMLLDLGTGALTSLSDAVGLASVADPDWSPDGQRIVVVGADGLDVIRADGRSFKLLPRSGDLFEGRPTFSPDGKLILFVATYSDPDDPSLFGQVPFVERATGSHPVRLDLPLGTYFDQPTWQPRR
jgi:Tol biopolymer transport system component